jgi:hypothetical protein
VQDIVDLAFDGQRLGDVVLDDGEPLIVSQMRDVLGPAGDVVIDGNDVMLFGQEPFA